MIDAPTPTPAPITHQCIYTAASRFNLPLKAIYAILAVEGGTVGKINHNSNGTYDIGPMQINSIWLKTFSGYITKEQLIYNGCVNVHVGAWILRANINQAGGNFWTGVGNYHSRTPTHHNRYQQKVYAAATKK